MLVGMERRASFFFVIATFAFGSLGMSPCEGGDPCVEQVDRLFLTTDKGDWFDEISATGACHLLDRSAQTATVQTDGAGTCVVTGMTGLTGDFRFERTVESFTTACGTMVLGVRDLYLRQITVHKLEGGVAPDAI